MWGPDKEFERVNCLDKVQKVSLPNFPPVEKMVIS